MLDLITVATTGLTGYFVQSACGGLVGNEAHRFYRFVMGRIGDDQAERANHDIARAVRLAQIDALDRVLAGYASRLPVGPAQPNDFLAAATAFCRTQRGRVGTDPASLALPSAEPLEATIDGLLAGSPRGSLSARKEQALGSFAEDAVPAELGEGPPAIAVPDDFAAYFRDGGGAGHPRFLDEFANDVREAVKSNPRFRDIFLLSGIAELKVQGFEIGEAVIRIEAQFGIARGEIVGALDRLERGQAEHTAMLKRLLELAESSGAQQRAAEQGIPEAAVRAIVLRLGGEGIDSNDLVAWLDNWIAAASEQLAKQSNEGEAFEAAREEAWRRFRAGRIKDASAAFMDEFAREERQEAERQAERKHHRVRLLEEAIRFDELAFDAPAAVANLRLMADIEGVAGADARGAWLHAKADEFYERGRDKGINAALAITIAAHHAVLEERTRERVPLDWAATQNSLGNALWALGGR